METEIDTACNNDVTEECMNRIVFICIENMRNI